MCKDMCVRKCNNDIEIQDKKEEEDKKKKKNL